LRLKSQTREAAERARAAEEQRRSEEALRASEERYRMLAEQSSDFIARHRMDGVLTYASSRCRPLLGYAPEEMVGMSYFELLDPADVRSVRETIRAVADAGAGIATVCCRVRRIDGGYVWLESRLSVLHDPLTQAPSEVLIASRDISEPKRVEAVRQELVAILSHDLKNPLTAVLGFAEILRDLPPDDPQRDEFLGRIEANAHAALTLAMNFVDASQINSGALAPRLEPVFLNETIEQAVRRQESRARVKQVRLETHLDCSEPMALLDPRLIDRVIANLVDNAIKSSPTKGCVSVETAVHNGAVVVRIQDQGTGVPEDQRPKLFQRSSEMGSQRSDSSGLGLFIVKALVDAQRGTVGAKFPSEGGTIFEISFPAGNALTS
jgi:PAS domain S-box-containing protein